MKPRILIFSIAYDPLIGGTELAVKNITDRIFEYEFDLITCRFDRRHKAFEKIGNVNVYRVGFGSRLGRLIYPALAFRLARRLHRQNPYQIIWGIMAAYAGAAALMFKKRFPEVKFILTLQEGDEISHIHRRVRGMKKRWQQIFQKADYIQAISKFLGTWARSEGAKCPIKIVPNGVDVEKIKNQKSKIKTTIRNSKIIITTSRLVRKNGIDILIRAVSILKTSLPTSDYSLLILGSGPEAAKLKRLAKDLGVADRIEFLGAVEPDKIPEHLAQADIFVRPSRSEGLGSSFLEAMAAGLPIIGTPVGGIVDFLIPSPGFGEGGHSDGQERSNANGLFANPEDPQYLAEKIKSLLENDELARKLGENGRKLVEEKYGWDHIAGEIKEIFNNLSSSPLSRSGRL